jgi:succinate dehydrogenase hydrophobic anchor subunit
MVATSRKAREPVSGWFAAGISALVLAVVLGVLVALGRTSASRDSGPGRPAA